MTPRTGRPLRLVLPVPATAVLLVAVMLVLLPTVSTGSPLGSGAAAAAAGPSYPYPTLGWPPAGANDWDCRPTQRRPYPAVIVHGTFGDQKSLLDGLSYSLKEAGFCVFALDYGNRATGPIEESARQLRRFVTKVRRATGAGKVEIVGHSQGGMMPRYDIKNLGGARFVEDLVGLSPSNHGTYHSELLAPLEPFCYSCTQQAADSGFLAALNRGDETPGRVDYTQVQSRYDEVVVPYSSAFLPGPRSTNITLQDRCPVDVAEHLTIPLDPQAIAWVLDAFTEPGPANPGAAIGCLG